MKMSGEVSSEVGEAWAKAVTVLKRAVVGGVLWLCLLILGMPGTWYYPALNFFTAQQQSNQFFLVPSLISICVSTCGLVLIAAGACGVQRGLGSLWSWSYRP